ncbi:MAG: terpene cyclase/mutase family protein [Rhodopirellula sp.]|nr:terpene cyclase/mutase family protein [Rhodopirellula sp.]
MSDPSSLTPDSSSGAGGSPEGFGSLAGGGPPRRGELAPVARPVAAAALPLPPAPPRPLDPLRTVPPVEQTPAPPRRWRDWLRQPGWRGCLASFSVHVVLLVVLGLMVLSSHSGTPGPNLLATFGKRETVELPTDPTEFQIARIEWTRLRADATEARQESETPRIALPEQEVQGEEVSSRAGVGFQAEHPADWTTAATTMAGGLQGRRAEARARLVQDGGGNEASEAAVDRGLRWLVAHQCRDGSWNFDHNQSACQGLCRHPGDSPSTTGATAIALLPFLGAGHTHVSGDYMMTVRDGLYYLGSRAVVTPDGADLREGTMYGQGLATIALCEAYALTKDRGLKDLAQQAIDFIVSAQDRNGGGWRYQPGDPGDTTVTGWQLMALRSGQMARLNVPSPTFFSAERFLDGVQSQEGALYGYMTPEPRPATTAVGLLSRMYSGWGRDHPALGQGAAYLSKLGPSKENDGLYFNYYATQVLHHLGGSDWQRWNVKTRDHLIATQSSEGHEAGSWYFPGRHSKVGGRLYCTAMAVMTLEVYYRYLPLYRSRAVDSP